MSRKQYFNQHVVDDNFKGALASCNFYEHISLSVEHAMRVAVDGVFIEGGQMFSSRSGCFH